MERGSHEEAISDSKDKCEEHKQEKGGVLSKTDNTVLTLSNE